MKEHEQGVQVHRSFFFLLLFDTLFCVEDLFKLKLKSFRLCLTRSQIPIAQQYLPICDPRILSGLLLSFSFFHPRLISALTSVHHFFSSAPFDENKITRKKTVFRFQYKTRNLSLFCFFVFFALFSKICFTQETLDEWQTCQRTWMYLESIFGSPDIVRQLPAAAKLFQAVDKSWRHIMLLTADEPLAIKQVSGNIRFTTARVGMIYNMARTYPWLIANCGSFRRSHNSCFFLRCASMGRIQSMLPRNRSAGGGVGYT